MLIKAGITMIYDKIFENKIPLFDKLLSFGFVLNKGFYSYSCLIVDATFELTICIGKDGKVQTKLLDITSEYEYTLHLAESAVGTFVGKVRADYFNILQKIADNCFETRIFQSEYALKIIKYIKEKYENDFEYLWQKFPNNAIARRKDNKKWYVALLTVEQNKIGLTGSDMIEIIDLRMLPEKIKELVDGEKYFPGYHMNKKHWITLCLNGSVDLCEIYNLIDESYSLARNHKNS